MEREASIIALVRKNTRIPVLEVYAVESDSDCSVKALFMLMECLNGNVGMDLGMKDFSKGLADIHAWCANATFGISGEQLQQACGGYAAEIILSIESFQTKLAMVASRLSKFDKGPFPLIYGDFGHNNIVVNDGYKIIGVIDWEMAWAAPWEVAGDFPLTLAVVPPAMDAPWHYDEVDNPKNTDLAKRFANQREYIANIKDAEDARSITESPRLSNLLQNSPKQRLMYGMDLYSNGKAGFYSNLVDDVS
ncbi:hypothetical protein GQ44DRAFT_763514 [Phaeosphaeriaceae sp. PMI808]|nr:hypothetical protein GQ44DRAFT_763514 [Phaeosphaeriaceae sp. PMI808]